MNSKSQISILKSYCNRFSIVFRDYFLTFKVDLVHLKHEHPVYISTKKQYSQQSIDQYLILIRFKNYW